MARDRGVLTRRPYCLRMIAKRIADANLDLGAPKGWDAEKDGSCHALAVRKVEDNVYQSAWEPTPTELAALNAGALVVLSVVGGQPPVMLSVEAPTASLL